MGGGWVNPLKNIFSDNIEWSFKIFWKMISADVKANIKQQETKDLVAVSYKSFLDVYFPFDFGWYSQACPNTGCLSHWWRLFGATKLAPKKIKKTFFFPTKVLFFKGTLLHCSHILILSNLKSC